MYHTHFNTIHSTQIYLRDNLVELKSHSNEILISTSEQTLGIGRKGSQWDPYPNSIAMSFTLKPNPVPTITPLEIGVLTSLFIQNEFGVFISLKWPNDLLTHLGLKCGGIIAQYIDSETVISGLGLNLGCLPEVSVPESYKHGLGNVSNHLKLTSEDQKNISEKLYNFILDNRIADITIMQELFYKSCHHIKKQVCIEDEGEDFIGKFMGIGKNGEALIEIDGITRAFLSSSLKIL